MADIITGTTTGFVNNIPDNTLNSVDAARREVADAKGEVIKEGLKESYATQGAIKDARFDINSRLNGMQVNQDDRFFAIGRDNADNRAQLSALGYQVRDGFGAAAKDMEIQALKTQQLVLEAVKQDGERTRSQIRENNDAALNRMLIERNAEIVEERHHARHWRGNFDQAQFQALQSQLQAFQSQLQETRQGMVNFGTMAGVGQTSTSNNVR